MLCLFSADYYDATERPVFRYKCLLKTFFFFFSPLFFCLFSLSLSIPFYFFHLSKKIAFGGIPYLRFSSRRIPRLIPRDGI